MSTWFIAGNWPFRQKLECHVQWKVLSAIFLIFSPPRIAAGGTKRNRSSQAWKFIHRLGEPWESHSMNARAHNVHEVCLKIKIGLQGNHTFSQQFCREGSIRGHSEWLCPLCQMYLWITTKIHHVSQVRTEYEGVLCTQNGLVHHLAWCPSGYPRLTIITDVVWVDRALNCIWRNNLTT